MTEIRFFLRGLALCACVAVSIIIVIQSRFFVMMADLCEGEERAGFWTLAVEVWFALSSIGSALQWHPEGTAYRQLFLAAVEQVKNGLSGTSIAIVLFSTGLVFFVVFRKFNVSESGILRSKSA